MYFDRVWCVAKLVVFHTNSENREFEKYTKIRNFFDFDSIPCSMNISKVYTTSSNKQITYTGTISFNFFLSRYLKKNEKIEKKMWK